MDVCIAKAGRNRPPTPLDDPGSRADVRPDGAIAPDRDDPTVANGHRARPTSRRAQGRDAPTTEHQVGWTIDGHACSWLVWRVARRIARRSPDPATDPTRRDDRAAGGPLP
jgi:hypothetical protein